RSSPSNAQREGIAAAISPAGLEVDNGQIRPPSAIINRKPAIKTIRAFLGDRISRKTASPSARPTAVARSTTPNINGQELHKPLPQWTRARSTAHGIAQPAARTAILTPLET